jgi:hypothetical protein
MTYDIKDCTVAGNQLRERSPAQMGLLIVGIPSVKISFNLLMMLWTLAPFVVFGSTLHQR